jgi:hypothetical protein
MHRRRRAGRPRKIDARRRKTTTAERRPPEDLGSALLRARKQAVTTREDLEVNGASVLFGHDHLDRMQYDTLGTVTEMLRRIARAWGGRDGSLNGLWEAITGALTSTRFAPAPVVGPGGYSLADGARRRLERACRSLDESRALVIELAEGRLPEIVIRVIERRLTAADSVTLEHLRDGLDALSGRRPQARRA